MTLLISKKFTWLGKILLGTLIFLSGAHLSFGFSSNRPDVNSPDLPVDFVYRNPNQSIDPSQLPHPYTGFTLHRYDFGFNSQDFNSVFQYDEEGRAYVEAVVVDLDKDVVATSSGHI
jgi:hypothetical protein